MAEFDDLVPIPGSKVTVEFTQEAADEFFAIVGRCIVAWAFVDRCLFDLCHMLLECDERLAAVVYYRNNNFGSRKALSLELSEAKLSSEDQNRLKFVWDTIEDHLYLRNIIAHNPSIVHMEIVWDLKAEGGPKAHRHRAWIEIQTEPGELLRGKKKAPEVVTLDQMRQDYGIVDRLHKDFRELLRAMKQTALDPAKLAPQASSPSPDPHTHPVQEESQQPQERPPE